MKRYPNGAAGEFFFMKRAPSPRPDWIETCRIEHDSGNVIDFPMIQDLAVAALGHQPRLHRPQPVVRALRRRRPARLPALRSRSRCRARPSSRCARSALLVRDALEALEMPPLVEDDRLEGHPRLRPDRARADAEGGLDVRQGARASSWRRGIPKLITAEYRVAEAPAGPRARRLQPERLGPHAGVDLLACGRGRARRSRRR